jgi:hypothetical protein
VPKAKLVSRRRVGDFTIKRFALDRDGEFPFVCEDCGARLATEGRHYRMIVGRISPIVCESPTRRIAN